MTDQAGILQFIRDHKISPIPIQHDLWDIIDHWTGNRTKPVRGWHYGERMWFKYDPGTGKTEWSEEYID